MKIGRIGGWFVTTDLSTSPENTGVPESLSRLHGCLCLVRLNQFGRMAGAESCSSHSSTGMRAGPGQPWP